MFKTLNYFWQVFRIVRQARKGEVSQGAAARGVLREAAAASGGDPDDFPEPSVDLSEEAMEQLTEPDFDLLYPDDFELTPQHVELIRNMRLSWNGTESGAPQQDPLRPFKGGPTLGLLDSDLGVTDDEQTKVSFLIDRRAALASFCQQAQLEPGSYQLSNITFEDVADALGWLDDWADRVGVDRDMRITLTAEDILLAKAVQWEWPDEGEMYDAFVHGEIAGPTVDPKRPYGDMSYIDLDIHRVLEWPTEIRNEDGFVALTDAQTEAATRLHFRQLCALQALLEHGRLRT